MKPLKLRMKYFGPYIDETMNFTEFDNTPLFLISGKTGSGKTTIFDAMSFALFDHTSGDERDAKQMRSDFATPNDATEVTFVFEHNGIKYTVIRSPKMNLAKDVTELLMLFFLYSSQYFQRAVTQLDVERNSLDQKLSDDINNKDLVELSNIEKSLVYLSSSIQTDLIMLHGLNHSKLDFTKEASERLDDVLIESSQSAEMVQISQQVTKTLSATSNNMMNNNLNDTMQFLTVWSLVLTIPTILTGFYGMNVSLPILKNSFDWVLIIILMVVLMVWLVILMKRHHFF